MKSDPKGDYFSQWFNRESGYSLHSGRPPHRSLKGNCCGAEPQATGLTALDRGNSAGIIRRRLYRCPVCKGWLFQERGGYFPSGSLLQYQIEGGEENECCDSTEENPGDHGGHGSKRP